MRKFYLFQKGQTLSAQLTWSHYVELLPIGDINRNKVKNNEYERLYNKTKEELITNEEENIEDFIKIQYL